jgi:arsenite methyltransferase
LLLRIAAKTRFHGPFAVCEINPSETVVDVASGSGFDSLVAVRLVGETGKVIGFDMTEEMLKNLGPE